MKKTKKAIKDAEKKYLALCNIVRMELMLGMPNRQLTKAEQTEKNELYSFLYE